MRTSFAARTTIRRIGLIGFAAVILGSCTAARVATHSTDADPVAAPPGGYTLDEHHWSIVFDVEHLGYSRFVMRFDRAAARLDFASDRPEDSRVAVKIDAASIDTNVAELDRMIAGPDMLDAAHNPEITFVSTRIRRTGATTGEITGDLTIRGRSVPVTLAATFNGGAPNPLTRVPTLGFAAAGSFDRSSLGLNMWFPAVGNVVNVTIQAEFAKDG